MVRLPVVSGRDVVRALEKSGYVQDREKGSHIVLRHAEPPFRWTSRPKDGPQRPFRHFFVVWNGELTSEEFVQLLK